MKTDLLESCDTPPASAERAGTARGGRLLRRRPSLEKAALSVFDQAVYSGTSFLTAVMVGRSCTQSELGIYYLTLTIVMVLFGIHENVIAGPYTIFSARRRGVELAEYTGSMWAHHAVLTGLGMLAIFVMVGVAAATGAVDFMTGLWTLFVAGPLLSLREGIRRLSFARLRQSTAIALDVTVSVLQLGGLASLWYLERLTVPAVFGVMGASCAIAAVGWFAFTPHPPRFVRFRFYQDWRHNWGFARWAVLSWLTVDTVPFLMPWIVDLAAGTAATGLYGACGTLVGVTNILVVGTGNFLRPKAAHSFANGGVPALRHVLLTAAGVFFVVFGLFSISLVFLGDWLGTFVYGQSFTDASGTLTALAICVMFNSIGFTAASGLWAIGRPRASLFADVSQLVTTLVAALFLVGPYGALGAASAASIGAAVGMFAKSLTLHLLLENLAADSASALGTPALSASVSTN